MSKLTDERAAKGVQAIEEELDKRAVIGMHLGSKSDLADALGITRQALSQWRRVPHERVLEIEKLLGVSRSVMRPDIYPPTEGTHGGHKTKAAAG
jgi:DNA-binding transcriptional regulator YdaS (Cro superfamily)